MLLALQKENKKAVLSKENINVVHVLDNIFIYLLVFFLESSKAIVYNTEHDAG